MLYVPEALSPVLAGHAQSHIGHVDNQAIGIARPGQGCANDSGGAVVDVLRSCGDDPRAGQRHMLPGPGLFPVVTLEAFEPAGRGAGATRRAQPHVDFIEAALRGRRGDGANQPLAKAPEPDAGGQGFFAIRRLRVRRMVVYEDQVQVRCRRQFSAAQLAERHDRQSAAGNPAMAAREFRLDTRQQGAQHRVGHGGQGLAGRRAADYPAQDLNPDPELLVVGPTAGQFQHVLIVVGLHKYGLQFGLEFGPRAQRLHEVAGQHGIQKRRVAAQPVGDARRAAHDLRHHVQHWRVGMEQ